MEIQLDEINKRLATKQATLDENKKINKTLLVERKMKDQQIVSLKGVVVELHKTVEQTRLQALNNRF